MDFPFPINRLATGTEFLTRRKEAEALSANMIGKRHTLLFDAPGTGKHTLVRNALEILKKDNHPYTLIDVDFYRCRTEESLLWHYAEAVLKALVPSEEEQETFTSGYLGATTDRTKIFSVPEIIGKERGEDIIVWLDEFQNLLNFDNPDSILKMLEDNIFTHKNVTYLIMGSKINAMEYIFDRIGYFFNFTERIVLSRLSEDDVIYHITRVFQKVGRVISREQSAEIYNYAQGNPWIIWHIANTCYNLTRGYVTDDILNEAVRFLLDSHEMEFHETIDSLSNYQLRLLRAVYDGEIRINSQNTIDKYDLNSSANVHRLKEALLKKEVITFDSESRPIIIDPLFNLWLKMDYFSGK